MIICQIKCCTGLSDFLLFFQGVHRIKIPHRRKVQITFYYCSMWHYNYRMLPRIIEFSLSLVLLQKYFIVMQSVFYPDDRINARYVWFGSSQKHKAQVILVTVQPLYMVWCVFLVARYDIKGCEVSRWTEPAPEGSQIIVVLKDLNFEGQYITLGKRTQCDIYVCCVCVSNASV